MHHEPDGNVGPAVIREATPRSPLVSAIDVLLERNRAAAMSHPHWIGPVPTMQVAMVVCMDTRIDTYRAFGLDAGEVHLLRNAGGVVTEDMIRSLAISQHALGTREVMIVHHTDCGLAKIQEDSFRDQLAEFAGYRPTWAVQAFRDPHDSVRESLLRVQRSPFLIHTGDVRGFVFDVVTGLLEEVEVADTGKLD
jgi:carbonic anhydrase